MPDGDLTRRIARLEAIEEIRQLPVRYAVGLDMRDIDAVVELFVADGRKVFFRNDDDGIAGGNDLRRSYFVSQGQYTNSQHFVLNHRIEIDDETHAHGLQYGIVEQEIDGSVWTICATTYTDQYELIDGSWRFAERRGRPWYFTTWNEPPVGPDKLKWPTAFEPAFFDEDGRPTTGVTPPTRALIPSSWPSWQRFWDEVGSAAGP